jgi:hypothetical protein
MARTQGIRCKRASFRRDGRTTENRGVPGSSPGLAISEPRNPALVLDSLVTGCNVLELSAHTGRIVVSLVRVGFFRSPQALLHRALSRPAGAALGSQQCKWAFSGLFRSFPDSLKLADEAVARRESSVAGREKIRNGRPAATSRHLNPWRAGCSALTRSSSITRDGAPADFYCPGTPSNFRSTCVAKCSCASPSRSAHSWWSRAPRSKRRDDLPPSRGRRWAGVVARTLAVVEPA